MSRSVEKRIGPSSGSPGVALSNASEVSLAEADLDNIEQFNDPTWYDNPATDSRVGGQPADESEEEESEAEETDDAEESTERANSHSTHSAGTPPPAQTHSPPAPQGLPQQG